MSLVRPARRADRDAFGRVAVAAFREDPLWTWLFPGPAYDRAALPFALADFDAGLAAGEIWLAEEADDLVAVAAWQTPAGARADEPVAALTSLGADPERLSAFFAAFDAAEPAEPHWTLHLIGTLPHHRGRGHAARLLRAVLDHPGRDAPAWLQTESPENVAWYQKHGFAVVDRTTLPAGPTLWFMRAP